MASKDLDYLKVPAPQDAEPSLMQKAAKEWQKRWWLWSVVLFAVVVCGGLLAFRGSLYSENVGMPLLAVTENAQELCDSKCTEEVGLNDAGEPANREQFESCLATCVKGETEQVAEERKDFAEEQKKEAEEEAAEEAAVATTDDQAEENADAERQETQEALAEAAVDAEGGVRRLLRRSS